MLLSVKLHCNRLRVIGYLSLKNLKQDRQTIDIQVTWNGFVLITHCTKQIANMKWFPIKDANFCSMLSIQNKS